MFTCSERHTVSRILAIATVAAWLLLSGVGQSPAFGANEKGPRCSDGIDNDGDSLIDCDDPDCKCGGDDGGGEEAVRYDVTTPPESAIEIIGVFDSEGEFVTDAGCEVALGLAEGRADKNQVIVNRPSPAIEMEFLAALPECFTFGDIYGLACGDTLVIKQAKNGSASIEYFFWAAGKNGKEQSYRIDGDAMIVADTPGSSFPTGDGGGYTVLVDNIRVSHDTGSRRNACDGSFPDTMAVIRLDRIQ